MILPTPTTTGSWVYETHVGHNTDEYMHLQGAGTDSAQWSTSLATGLYRISATWYPFSNRATDAKYEVYDGATLRGTVYVNQVSTPSDRQDGGVGWKDLGQAFEIGSGTLTVKVYQSGTGQVIADAARVEYMGPIDPNPPPPPTGVTFAQLEAEAANARDALKAVADEQYEYAVQRAHELTGQ